MSYAVALEAWVNAHIAVLDLIFTGSDIATISVYDADDVLLTEATLDIVTSSVDTETGILSLEVLDQDASADASGTASYAHIISASGLPIMELPCEVGTVASAAKCIMSTLAVVEATSTNVLSVSIQPGTILS